MSCTIDITERITDLVSHVPADAITHHGGAHSLEVKIHDLIFPLEDDAPKKRGRPKGSPNKPKETPTEVPTETKKRGRGRPKGSPNKPKETHTEVPTETKRGPGRPPKNPQ